MELDETISPSPIMKPNSRPDNGDCREKLNAESHHDDSHSRDDVGPTTVYDAIAKIVHPDDDDDDGGGGGNPVFVA